MNNEGGVARTNFCDGRRQTTDDRRWTARKQYISPLRGGDIIITEGDGNTPKTAP